MTIKVGDLITAYRKGYHRVIGFHDYESNILVTVAPGEGKQVDYQPVLSSTGKPKGGKPDWCSIDYCTVVTEASILAEFEAEVKAAEQKRDVLLSILKGDSDEVEIG